MRDVTGQPLLVRHRVKGRPALLKRLRGVLIAARRFAVHRATSADDVRWAGRLLDDLLAALHQAEEDRP